MAALAFCIDTNRRDLENARMVAITTDRKKNTDMIIPSCDKSDDQQVSSLHIRPANHLY